MTEIPTMLEMPPIHSPEEIRHREIIAELKKIEEILEKGLFPETWKIGGPNADTLPENY